MARGDPGACAAAVGWAGASQGRRRTCASARFGDLLAVPHPGTRALGEFHAFIIADLQELRGRAGQSILLQRIQNPWGRRCWQGPWREG